MASGLLLNRYKCWLANLPHNDPDQGKHAFGIRWLYGEDILQLWAKPWDIIDRATIANHGKLTQTTI